MKINNSYILYALIILNVLLCFYVIRLQSDNSKIAETSGTGRMPDILLRDSRAQTYMNGRSVDPNIGVRTNEGESFPLVELLDRKKLFIRYSDIHCNSCVDTMLTYVSRFAERIGDENVVILSRYQSHRDYVNFLRINRIHMSIYNLTDTLCEADRLDVPYMFINEDNYINNFFIFRKESPHDLLAYLEMVDRVINSQSSQQ